MKKPNVKKVAAKAPTAVAKKAAQKPATKKVAAKKVATKAAAKPQIKKTEAAAPKYETVAKPTKEQRKQAQQARKMKSLRKQGKLPPPNPRAGELTGKRKAPGKRAEKAALAVQTAIAPKPGRVKPDPEARVNAGKKIATGKVAPINEELKAATALDKPATNLGSPKILPSPPLDTAYVGVNYHRQTCIVISRAARVRFIPFATNGMYILTQEAKAFDLEYKPCDYPIPRAAKMYHDAARFIECAENARDALAQLAGIAVEKTAAPSPTDLEITKEFDMKKIAATETTTPADKKASGKVAKLDTKPIKAPKGAAKKAAAKKTAAPAKEKKEAGEGAGPGRTSPLLGKKITALVKPTEHGAREGTTRAERRSAVLKCKTTDAALEIEGVDGTVLANMVKLKLIKIG